MKSLLDKQQIVAFDGNTSEVIVRKRHGNKIQGAFSAISVITNKKRMRGAMQQDVFDLLDQVSKGAFSVFNNLKFNRDEETNITQYQSDGEMSKTDREVLSRKLAELRTVGLIRKMKKEIKASDGGYRPYVFKDPRTVFIINPIMIRCSKHDEALYLWNQCDPKGDNHAAAGHPPKPE